jgi:hypothetical protein
MIGEFGAGLFNAKLVEILLKGNRFDLRPPEETSLWR